MSQLDTHRTMAVLDNIVGLDFLIELHLPKPTADIWKMFHELYSNVCIRIVFTMQRYAGDWSQSTVSETGQSVGFLRNGILWCKGE